MMLQDSGLYKILSLEENAEKLSAKLQLEEGHDIFKGHFPQEAVLPGVCMIQIVKELMENEKSGPLTYDSSKNIKFLAPVKPHIDPCIFIDIQKQTEEGFVNIIATLKNNEVTAFNIKGKLKSL